VARAVESGRPRRIVLLSYVGADERSSNAYLRSTATAERILRATGKDPVVFRCTYIIGPPEAPGPSARGFMAEPGKKPRVIGDRSQVVAPIYLGDVVDAVLAAVDRGGTGIYNLAGPERMPLDELVRLLNLDPTISITHVPVWLARVLSLFVPNLPGALVDTLARDSVDDSSPAIRTFGLELHALRDIWTTSGDPTSPATTGRLSATTNRSA
jgi:uncharacterized protein YbjT (DUF2867 family)